MSTTLPPIHERARHDARDADADADSLTYEEFLESMNNSNNLNSESSDTDDDQPTDSNNSSAKLVVTKIELKSLEHKAFTTHAQKAGTVLMMFRHYARIGHHINPKKMSKESKPQKMVC